MLQPKESWVARWQRIGNHNSEQGYTSLQFGLIIIMRIDKYTQGVYAIRVYGRVPDYVEDELDRRGITYRPRDGTVTD